MMVMILRIVFSSRMLMARSTQLVVAEFYFGRMDVVTIRTLDSIVVHLALDKRTVHVIFIANLAVVMIDAIHHRLRRKVIIEIAAGTKIIRNRSSPRMTGSTSLNLRQITFRF